MGLVLRTWRGCALLPAAVCGDALRGVMEGWLPSTHMTSGVGVTGLVGTTTLEARLLTRVRQSRARRKEVQYRRAPEGKDGVYSGGQGKLAAARWTWCVKVYTRGTRCSG